jgi:hypothetical protein
LLEELIGKYAWVNDIEAWTVAVIEGKTRDDMIRIYGGDPGNSVGDYYFAQMADLQGPGDPEHLRFHVQVFTHGSFVVAVEENGWTGSLPEIARRCSAGGGQFFSVYWNVNAFGLLTQAIDGKVAARFEALYPIAPDPPQPNEIRPPWAVGPEPDVGLSWQICMALMEQQTGLAFDQQWLSDPRPTYRIPNPHWMLRDVENVDLV